VRRTALACYSFHLCVTNQTVRKMLAAALVLKRTFPDEPKNCSTPYESKDFPLAFVKLCANSSYRCLKAM
jgi:hypothetical protein